MRVALKAVLVAGGLLLSACARDPFVTEKGETRYGEWWIVHQIDRITDAELPNAFVYAAASNSNLLYPLASNLLLTCFRDRKPLIRFAFRFKIGTEPNTVLAYRFDDLPGHEDVPIRVVRGSQVIAIEDRDAIARFVAELERSRLLYVRIRSLNGGRTTAEYPVQGSPAAIRAAFGNCDMPAPVQPDAGRVRLPGIY